MLQQASGNDYATPIVLAENLNQKQLVDLQALNAPAIKIQGDFERTYPDGPVFSSVVGYTGRVNPDELKADPALTRQAFIGKAGVEAFYAQPHPALPPPNH